MHKFKKYENTESNINIDSITPDISGVHTSEPGEYDVKYTFKDSHGTDRTARGVETSILSTCNNYKPRWKSNGVFFNRFFGGFVLRATLKSNFVASAMSCSIMEISLLRL